jgi:DNA primase
VLDQAVRDRNLHRPAQKAEAVEEVLPYIRAVRNGIQKREYFDIAMDALRIEEATLRKELWQTVKAGNADASLIRQKVTQAAGAHPTIAEQKLLELLFTDEELRHSILPRIEAADYEDLPTAAVFRALKELDEEGRSVDFSSLSEKTEGDAVAADLLPLLLMHEPQRADGEALDDLQVVAESCLVALRLMAIDRRIGELGAEIATSERAGDMERRDRLALEHLELSRRRSALFPRTEESAYGVSGH